MNATTSTHDPRSPKRESAARAARASEAGRPLTDTLTSAAVILTVYGLLMAMTLAYRMTLAAL